MWPLKSLGGMFAIEQSRRHVPLKFTLLVSSVLQPNSPQAIVKTALESANKSRLVGDVFRLGADHDPYR